MNKNKANNLQKHNISKMPLHIILKQPAIKIMIVLYFAIIMLMADCFKTIFRAFFKKNLNWSKLFALLLFMS